MENEIMNEMEKAAELLDMEVNIILVRLQS